jgi:transcriptional regulator with XRE-family HTH domain
MTQFSETLKSWRNMRRLSQLELAVEAEVSARHISFLETGRAQPSREMVGRLCEALQLPLTNHNQLLKLAGFAPRYIKRDWQTEEMAPVREAIAHMLNAHAPYPAIGIDRLWTIVEMNRPAQTLFGMIGVTIGTSLIDLITADRLQPFVENWSEVAQHSAQRLRTESAAHGGIPELDRVATKLSEVPHDHKQMLKPVIPTVFRVGDIRLSLFSTIAQFGTPEDLALDELKLEMFFPADADTKDTLEALEKVTNS